MAEHNLYLPEIHDLHPGMADRLERLIGIFPENARPHIAYSIVPNWHGAAPLDAHPEFTARVAALPGAHVLHGWMHTKGPDFLNWLLYGHENRSEFQGLNKKETELRLDLGLECFARAGLQRPVWFCAPRWMPSPSLNTALTARGFRGVLARGDIQVFGGATIAASPLNFDEGARAWKIAPGRVLREATIARILRANRPFRFVVHPDDLDHQRTLEQIKRTMARFEAEGWSPVSLETLVGCR